VVTRAHRCTEVHGDGNTCVRMIANVHKCLQMRTDIHKCAQMFTNAHTCIQMLTDVHKCAFFLQMLTDVHKCAQMFTKAHRCSHVSMFFRRLCWLYPDSSLCCPSSAEKQLYFCDFPASWRFLTESQIMLRPIFPSQYFLGNIVFPIFVFASLS